MFAEQKKVSSTAAGAKKALPAAKPIEYREVTGRKLAVLTNPKTRAKRMVPAEVFEKQWKFAKWALEERPNYLHAVERGECMRVLECQDAFTIVNPEKSRQRIDDLNRAKVPGIFKEELEGQNAFPAVDFVLRVFRGDAWDLELQEERRRIQKKGKTIWFNPAAARHVRYFRTYAFDDRRISPQVIADLNDYVLRNRKAGFEAVSHQTRVLKYLEKALGWMEPGERTFRIFQKGEPLDFVRSFMWHIRYSVEDRLRILEDFIQRVRAGEEAIISDKRLIERMELFFPEQIQGSMADTILEVKLLRAVETGDYLYLSFERLPENYHAVMLSAVEQHIERTFDALSDELDIVFNKRNLNEYLKLSNLILCDPHISQFITKKQMELLERLSDEQVCEHKAKLARTIAKHKKNTMPRELMPFEQAYLKLASERLASVKQ